MAVEWRPHVAMETDKGKAGLVVSLHVAKCSKGGV
jgi:hypothetical protein